MDAPDITIISTYATDRIYDEVGNWILDQEGGPCLFILDVLQQKKISHHILAPTNKAIVDIRLYKTGEVGTVQFVPALKVDWASITSPYILISTIFDEISLISIDQYKGNICLDAQGFVRKAKSDNKAVWDVPDFLYKNCFCLKATEEELKYIPSKFVEQQKQNFLILTRGSRGVEYWEKGKRKEAIPDDVIACSHAIGAGDTFFTSVIVGLLQNQPLDMAIESGLRTTSVFLKRNLNLIK